MKPADLLKCIFGIFGAFVVGRTLIALVVTALTWLGFWAVGCPLPWLFAVGIGLLVIIPLAPLILVAVAAIATVATVEAHPVWSAVGVLGIGIAIVILEAYALTPWILGRKLELGFFTVLAATLGFGILFGFFGVLFAVPLAAVAKLLGKEVVLPLGRKTPPKETPSRD